MSVASSLRCRPDKCELRSPRPLRLKGSLCRCGRSRMRNHDRSHVLPMTEKTMTKAQAVDLQAKWKQQGSPLCEHLKVELERNEVGCLTGNYQCTTCGRPVPR